jgi:L-lysine exporter family protein LysE/ArgO
MGALLAGLVTGLSLIVAIGAQNAFVLRQGLARAQVTPIVVVCAASDLVLIVSGVAGLGALIAHRPSLLAAITWGGAAFLLIYAVRAAVRALRPAVMSSPSSPSGLSSDGAAISRRPAAVGTALALTWLNPHVYLDTVLLLGTLAAAWGRTGQWWFAAGAGLASIGWFCGLGYGSRLLRGFFGSPRSWRILDLIIAAVMLGLALALVLDGPTP